VDYGERERNANGGVSGLADASAVRLSRREGEGKRGGAGSGQRAIAGVSLSSSICFLSFGYRASLVGRQETPHSYPRGGGFPWCGLRDLPGSFQAAHAKF
jgi:hypothetical protein